jgi:crotonobetainyl-CoA:carnitine CoA-transferase CaiB-like acyl-CoA transferase
MTSLPMAGVRVVEVAQYTFVPAAGAMLADWGADVLKVEHPVTGDAQRGFRNIGPASAVGPFPPILEHPNHGKRSIGLALDDQRGIELLYELVRSADVFTTNFLPAVRARLGIDVDQIRAVNPSVVYVRGSAVGARGEESEKGGFDQSTFWCRGGGAASVTPPNLEGICNMPLPAFGDSTGAVAIAAGISAALFARERTGEGSVVDVSLLSAAAWSGALGVDLSLISGQPWSSAPVTGSSAAPTNPLSGFYGTSDGRWIFLSMTQPGRYWEEFCRCIDRVDLIYDDRFDTAEKLMSNAGVASEIISSRFAEQPYEKWLDSLATLSGPWECVQNTVEVGRDRQLIENGFIAEVIDVEGTTRHLVAPPVQFDQTPAVLRRAPEFGEHTDEVLRELGLSEEDIIEFKIAGVIN